MKKIEEWIRRIPHWKGLCTSAAAAFLVWMVSFGIVQVLQIKYNHLHENKETLEKSIEELRSQQKEQLVLNSQLEEQKKQNDQLESELEMWRRSASLTQAELSAACQPVLENLYQEQEMWNEQVKKEIAEVYQLAYQAVMGGTDTLLIEEEADYLADAVSEVTGLDSAGTAVSAIVEGIENGTSLPDVLDEVSEELGESFGSDVLNALLGKIFPSEMLDTVTFGMELLGEKDDAQKVLLKTMLENNHYYTYELYYHLEQEEMLASDFTCILSDLNELNEILQTTQEMIGQDLGYPNFEKNCDVLRQCQEEKSRLEEKIQFYETLAGKVE